MMFECADFERGEGGCGHGSRTRERAMIFDESSVIESGGGERERDCRGCILGEIDRSVYYGRRCAVSKIACRALVIIGPSGRGRMFLEVSAWKLYCIRVGGISEVICWEG